MKSFFASVLRRFQYHFSTIGAIRRGEATLKAYLAGVGTIDYGFLPYPEVIDLVARFSQIEG